MSFSAEERAIILKAIQDAGIAKVTAEYHGYGDSGDFETPYFQDAEGKPVEDVDKILLPIQRPEQTIWLDGTYAKKSPGPYNLQGALYDLFYDMVESEHPGWEINEGADGVFVWTEPNLIDWQHDTRIETYERESWEGRL